MPKHPKTYIKILEAALPLFAAYGYNGVSMRDISSVVDITAAALYNHFPNKEQLHLKALEYAFAKKVQDLSGSISASSNPEEQLTCFISFWVETFGRDITLRSLLQREMADAEQSRIKLLAEHVFKPVFREVGDSIQRVSNGLDQHLLFISIIGLVMYHFELSAMRKLLPGYDAEHDQPEKITKHIKTLLLNGLDNNS
jgi:TetR/AcrR family transcriptional regulator